MNITILDLVGYVKKHLLLISIVVIVAVIVGIVYLDKTQTYTASTTIKYSNMSTETGYDTFGKKIDPYEIMSPTVIEKALDGASGASVEEVRSGITITPLINETTKKTHEALTDKGETFSYFPNEFTVTFRHSERYGSNYGVQILSRLLESYDSYIQQTHTNTKQIPNVFTNIDYSQYDYMEVCDLYREQFDTIDRMLQSMENEAPEFRSSNTGLTFNNVRYYFMNVKEVEYRKLYAYVREGCLSKNKEVLLKNYRYTIDNLQLTMNKRNEEANLSFGILTDFYKKFKEGQGVINSEDTAKAADTNKMIIDKDSSKLTTTYDTILLGYVDKGVDAVTAQKEIEHYQTLIGAFENDIVSPEVKEDYKEKADNLIVDITARLNTYIEMANQTLKNYNVYKSAKYLSYLSSVSMKPTLSTNMIFAFSFLAGIALGMLIAIGIEIFKRLKEEAALEAKRRKISMIESGKLPENFDELPPFDKALFEAISNDFKEFKLFYQPIMSANGKYVGAEALVRWDSAEFGLVMPNDFIAVAEKYDIMELLGKWITKEACIQCKKWNEEYDPDFFVSVNFTLKQVTGQIFIDCIGNAVEEVGIRANNLVLEVSGGSDIEDMQATQKRIQIIKHFGVRVAVDGYTREMSSANVATTLKVDMVKLNRIYAKDVATNIATQNIVTMMVNNAKTVDIIVCSEGVETKESEDCLKKLGIQYLQGYYYAKPAEADKIQLQKDRFEEM